jgi:hypothetical protein
MLIEMLYEYFCNDEIFRWSSYKEIISKNYEMSLLRRRFMICKICGFEETDNPDGDL